MSRIIFCSFLLLLPSLSFAADNNSALISAAQTGQVRSMERLIDMGANINTQDKNGRTPLMWGIMNRKKYVVKNLLKLDIDVNLQDANGNTALIYAVKRKRYEDVDALLGKGADVLLHNKKGKTALDTAKLIHQKKIVGKLELAESEAKIKADADAKANAEAKAKAKANEERKIMQQEIADAVSAALKAEREKREAEDKIRKEMEAKVRAEIEAEMRAKAKSK